MKVFYHADLDGICSAAIIHYNISEPYTGMESYFKKEYGSDDKLDRSIIEEGETVYVVDFCFPYDDMLWLKENTTLIWIDHHISSIGKMKGIDINGLQSTDRSGCCLTWDYFNKEEIKSIPDIVFLLGDYDTWTFEDARSLPFQYGMQGYDNIQVDDDIWAYSFNNSLSDNDYWTTDKIVERGNVILDYIKQNNSEYMEGYGFETTLEDYNVIATNIGRASSRIFDSLYDPKKHDIMLAYANLPEGGWRVSLYSTKDHIDCSKIAQKRGGGGHKGAAGFVCDDDSFLEELRGEDD
jgi:uncharacterized protein